MMHAIDVSSYQGEIDWAKLGQSRYRLVVAKLSEGIGGSQLDYALAVGLECAERGMDFGVYHFADKYMRNSARDEGKNFARLFAGIRHLCTIAPTLDVEPKGTGNAWGKPQYTRDELAAWCKSWASVVGVQPIIYTPAGRSYVEQLLAAFPDSPRWLSSRPWRISKTEDRPPDDPEMPDGCELWQYSSRCGGVTGIDGNCDRNLVRDICKLRGHWKWTG